MTPLLTVVKPLCDDALFHALSHLPPAFELVAFDRRRASPDDVRQRRAVFNREVKPDFLRHLAEDHEADLAAMGLNAQAIERMRDGDMPENTGGQRLNASVDHIRSLSLGGTNDFDNLALVPRWLNALKDRLENPQLDAPLPGGAIVTIAPRRVEGAYPKVPPVAGGFTRAGRNF